MKPLLWDSINPVTGQPFTWGDPNVFWGSPSYFLEPGDPGYVPYPGTSQPPSKKKRKPFRRKAANPNTEPPTPNYIMPTFQYHIAPNPHGGFTTRPVMRQSVTEEAFFAKVAADSGLSVEQSIAAFDAIVGAFLACAGGCDHGVIRDKIRFRPTSGGSDPAPDGFNNAQEINADVALSFTATARDAWRATLTLESQGEIGKSSPLIDSILSQENGAEDQYTPGALIVLNGDNLRFNKADPAQGVFFRSGNNPEVRATTYGTLTPTSLSVMVPATLSGPLTVRVATYMNGSVRSFTYMDPITQ